MKEIRIFDLDKFNVHNAFRSPGKTTKGEFGKAKTQVYKQRYSDFRHGIKSKTKFIDITCEEDLNDVTFAFVCVDKGSSRREIFDLLLSKKIAFIDVGMGLNRKKGSINGMLQTTYYSARDGEEVFGKGLAVLTDKPDDIYKNQHSNWRTKRL